MLSAKFYSKRRVKIVCTLGPSTSDLESIKKLIHAGMNVARLNFSHGDHVFHEKVISHIRQASQETKRPVAILQDLQGPKIRVGQMPEGGLTLKEGDELKFTSQEEDVAKKGRIPTSYPCLEKDLKVGETILLDDGNFKLKVTQIESDGVVAKVVYGGVLKSKKGMNLPDSNLSIQSFTEKDHRDLIFALKHRFDFIALSFVRAPEDVTAVKRIIHTHKLNIPVIAKIEKSEAIRNFEEILSVSDGIMVARGDLAVEIGSHKVPKHQKAIIRRCNQVSKPVITATQMLESMVGSTFPTRAEASDVANAVYDGTDAVMLSAETASGLYPIESVTMMSQIVGEAEKDLGDFHKRRRFSEDQISREPIEKATVDIAISMNAKGIACVTNTGTVARKISKYRPEMPIWALTDREEIYRRLCLYWGVNGILINELIETDRIFEQVERLLVNAGAAKRGDFFIMTAGIPVLTRGTTNMVKIHLIKMLDEGAGKKGGEVEYVKATPVATKEVTTFLLDQEICIGCKGCVEICPFGIFEQKHGKARVVESQCVNCTDDLLCVDTCPTSAIEIVKTF